MDSQTEEGATIDNHSNCLQNADYWISWEACDPSGLYEVPLEKETSTIRDGERSDDTILYDSGPLPETIVNFSPMQVAPQCQTTQMGNESNLQGQVQDGAHQLDTETAVKASGPLGARVKILLDSRNQRRRKKYQEDNEYRSRILALYNTRRRQKYHEDEEHRDRLLQQARKNNRLWYRRKQEKLGKTVRSKADVASFPCGQTPSPPLASGNGSCLRFHCDVSPPRRPDEKPAGTGDFPTTSFAHNDDDPQAQRRASWRRNSKKYREQHRQDEKRRESRRQSSRRSYRKQQEKLGKTVRSRVEVASLPCEHPVLSSAAN